MLTKDDYQRAIDVQGACNLSGVVFDFAKVMQKVCDECREQGTEARNTHPIVVMYVTQLAHLSGVVSVVDGWVYEKAYNACQLAIDSFKINE